METATEFDDSFGNVPEGKCCFAVLNHTGDTKVIWDPNVEDEVENARAQWDRLVGSKRFSAFRVSGEDGKCGERMTEFDPQARRVIFVPPVQGGR